MPAPDLETLLDFETNFETASKTFLENETGLPTSSLFATLDQDEFVVPRIEVMFEKGEANDPVIAKKVGSTEMEYLEHEGNLVIRVISDASVTGTQTNHRTYRAKTRKAMLLNSDNWTTSDGAGGTILPYYAVLYQRETGTEYEVEGDLAISTLNYAIVFNIKNDAFPD